jgi:hypothetical protein
MGWFQKLVDGVKKTAPLPSKASPIPIPTLPGGLFPGAPKKMGPGPDGGPGPDDKKAESPERDVIKNAQGPVPVPSPRPDGPTFRSDDGRKPLDPGNRNIPDPNDNPAGDLPEKPIEPPEPTVGD